MGNIHRMTTPNKENLRIWGVGRDKENPKAVVVCFSRPLTDAELRFFHDVCGRSAPLMEAAAN